MFGNKQRKNMTNVRLNFSQFSIKYMAKAAFNKKKALFTSTLYLEFRKKLVSATFGG